MLQRIALFACMALLSSCTETGDSAYTYLDTSAPDTSEGVYWEHAEPLLTKACVGCHTGGSNGGTNFGNVYEDNLKPSYYCQGKTVGECVLVRIDDGTMPRDLMADMDLTSADLDLASGPVGPVLAAAQRRLSAASHAYGEGA